MTRQPHVLNINCYTRLENAGLKMVCRYDQCNKPIEVGQKIVTYRCNGKIKRIYHEECEEKMRIWHEECSWDIAISNALVKEPRFLNLIFYPFLARAANIHSHSHVLPHPHSYPSALLCTYTPENTRRIWYYTCAHINYERKRTLILEKNYGWLVNDFRGEPDWLASW